MKATRHNMRVYQSKHPIMHCSACQSDFSADPNDYFDTPEFEEMTCSECDEPLDLVTVATIYSKL